MVAGRVSGQAYKGSGGKRCPICGGRRIAGTTTFAVDLGFGVVVVRNVPAQVCEQCGEAWLDDAVAERLEDYVADARHNRQQVAVLAMQS